MEVRDRKDIVEEVEEEETINFHYQLIKKDDNNNNDLEIGNQSTIERTYSGDQRKITPNEIFDKILINTKIKASTTTTTVCDKLWPNREFLQHLKDTIHDEEEKCEFITKENLILHCDNITGDRVRELSEWHHKYLVFLTYKPVSIAMYVTYFILLGFDVSWISKGNTIAIPLLAIGTLMIFVYPPFFSKILVGKRLGIMHDFNKLTTSPFKNNAVSHQFLTGYEIIDCIIAFNLIKLSSMPTLYCKAVEERANLNHLTKFMYFGLFIGTVFIPAIMFWFEIYRPIVSCSTHVCDPFLSFLSSFTKITCLTFLGGNIVETLVIFLVTLSSHFFQIEVFKNRLELDRTKQNREQGQWKSQRQLVEEYLFHQELLSRSASIWQGLLCFSLIFTLIVFIAMCIVSLILISIDTAAAVLFLFYGIISVILFFLFLFIPAQLNSSCGDIITILTKGADDDWELYGKRNELLQYFQSNPLECTVYKFAITYSWLIGFGSGIISTLFAIAISFYLGV